MDAREVVLDVLLDIEQNNTFSNIALQKALKKNQFEDKKLRAFVTRMCEGITEKRITTLRKSDLSAVFFLCEHEGRTFALSAVR